MTRGDKAVRWIENFCVYPHSFNKGQHVVLTEEKRETLRRVFDTDGSPEVSGPLAAYLALLVVAGPRALAGRITGIELDADVFTTWAATGPDLKSVLHVERGSIVCKELQTRFPPVAA